jgi:quercetin dioxygenase-like cupin family protein
LEERDPVQTALPADLEALAASAVGREGVIWNLEAGKDLNANLVRFGAGWGVEEHVNDEVDVVFVGVLGVGFVGVDGRGTPSLEAGKLVFVPNGARRSTRGASEDFAYLTVHERRGPLQVGAKSEPEQTRRR